MKWNQELARKRHVPYYGGHLPVEYRVVGVNFKFKSIESVAAFIESTKGAVQGKFYRSGSDTVEVNGYTIKRRFLATE